MESISLHELCSAINQTLEEQLAGTCWVRAEISSLSAKAGGHCYMELVDKDPNGGMRAKQKATCWANVWRMVSAYFQTATGQAMSVGMQVLLEVTISFHPVYGLSLNVQNVEPSFTLGALAQQRQATIARLREEGMMELQKSLHLPTLVKRIAVVSSPDAAGYQDFIHTLSPRADIHNLSSGQHLLTSEAGYAFLIELFPATMQGENAPRSIMHALDRVYERPWDVVVITRGGGATTDLGCFDDYELCNYCAQFPYPIFSAVGHTRDVSVLDMVCYADFKTPTFVAEWILQVMDNQAQRIDDLVSRLQQTGVRQISLRKERLVHLETVVRMRLQAAIAEQKQKITFMEKTIDMHSPEAIFRKGYSLTMKDGRPVRSASDIQPGDLLTTVLAEGVVTSVAESNK